MTEWRNICRICSCKADYEVFAKIPNYLHSQSNEFINWQKPVSVLIEETTGLKVSKDDGLPKNICALCISYLKHAVNFREQVLRNTLSLKLILHLGLHNPHLMKNGTKKKTPHEDKASLLVTSDDLAYNYERETDTNSLLNNANAMEQNNKVEKKLLNNVIPLNMPMDSSEQQQSKEQQMQYVNLLFNKHKNAHHLPKRTIVMVDNEVDSFLAAGNVFDEEAQTASSSSEETDEAAGNATKPSKPHMFSYEERNFEEDDITELDDIRDSITVNIPESCKERKCRACYRRYMFEDSYNEHMKTCIEYKFLTFVTDINRLLEIRRSRSVSPHEFVRRMIFALRKICEWLNANCQDLHLPDFFKQSSTNNERNGKNKRSESEEQSSSSIEAKATGSKLLKNKRLSELQPKIINTTTFETIKSNASGHSTPISCANNILYEIERSLSQQSQHKQVETLNEEVGVQYYDTQANTTTQHNYENFELPKPIAMLATNIPTAMKTPPLPTLAMIEQQMQYEAAKQANFKTPAKNVASNDAGFYSSLPPTPQISVRTDLLMNTISNTSPLEMSMCTAPVEMPVSAGVIHPSSTLPTGVIIAAVCTPCNLGFENIGAFEMHNAMNHNNLPKLANVPEMVAETEMLAQIEAEMQAKAAAEAERRRIIALFEESSGED